MTSRGEGGQQSWMSYSSLFSSPLLCELLTNIPRNHSSRNHSSQRIGPCETNLLRRQWHSPSRAAFVHTSASTTVSPSCYGRIHTSGENNAKLILEMAHRSVDPHLLGMCQIRSREFMEVVLEHWWSSGPYGGVGKYAGLLRSAPIFWFGSYGNGSRKYT